MTARFHRSQVRGGRAAATGVVPSTLEAVVIQLRAALAIAEAALNQGAAEQPTVYTVADVARIVGCSEETVRRRIHAGQLDAVTSGARWLVSAAALDRYLSGDSSSSTSAA
jgi:excisionase family DNA binding protein